LQRNDIMATRKIRLTMSGTKVEDQGPIVDIDFNGENLDADVDVGAVYGESTVVKEYTVDVESGTYNLDINFKNDSNTEGTDRNLYVEFIEYANDGINYESLIINASNTNLSLYNNFPRMGWLNIANDSYDSNLPKVDGNRVNLENPTYNSAELRTDDKESGYIIGLHPGNNPKFQYNLIIHPVKIWLAGINTFNITFS
jgi:hypothetical protein